MAKETKVTEKTIEELCKKVASNSGHLLPNDEDAVVMYQDLIGHATVEENRDLANDPALMETFYRIYGVAYGTVAAIKFYMQNSNSVQAKRDDLKMYEDMADKYREKIAEQADIITGLNKMMAEAEMKEVRLNNEVSQLNAQLETRDREIMELKAKLYDAMQK